MLLEQELQLEHFRIFVKLQSMIVSRKTNMTQQCIWLTCVQEALSESSSSRDCSL